MSRRMSCSMTIDAVRAREKTVTRRRVDTWRWIGRGDRLTLIEKGMGLPKGAKQIVLAEVEIVGVEVQALTRIVEEAFGTGREGLLHMSALEFCRFWLDGHGYKAMSLKEAHRQNLLCRRIEWRYLDCEPFDWFAS